MFTIKKTEIANGHDCWGCVEYDDVWDVYCDDEFVCRMASDPTALIDKVNGILVEVEKWRKYQRKQ
ncbi:hypothetical protein [Clostridium fessum]|uniref:hypothetical protein n=1 Tax=Clostridium fessum TaxID=2126740 RepID=UPI003AF1CD0F